jgi:hypothetical protein
MASKPARKRNEWSHIGRKCLRLELFDMKLSEVIAQLTTILNQAGDMRVEVRNPAGDLDHASLIVVHESRDETNRHVRIE